MKFRLGTIAYVFALLAAGMAAFGPVGIVAATVVAAFWAGCLAWSQRVQDLCLSLATIAGAIVLLVAPSISLTPSGPSSRSSCQNNLKQILLGLGNYEAAHGRFPPPFIADASGKPMHSWRVLILPYMEHASLFNRYRMDEPWDGPNNRVLGERMPDVYRCPGCERCEQLGLEPFGKRPVNTTNYFAIVGENVGWSEEGSKTYKELKGGTKNTLMVMEHGGKFVPWMEPDDLTAEEAVAVLSDPRTPSHPSPWEKWFSVGASQHGSHGGTCNGHVRPLPNALTEDEARAAIAIGGADLDELARIERTSVTLEERWRYERIYGVGLFIGLALWPAVGAWRRRLGLAPAGR